MDLEQHEKKQIQTQRRIPTIRFPGFTDPWEQRKLGDVAEFNPKSELPEAFEYVDLEAVVGTEMVSHRAETRVTAPSRAQRLAQTGDIFFQTVRPYQKNNYLFSKPDKCYVFSTGYAQMRPKIDAEFLMCFLQTDSFVKIVLDNCTGTSYPAINSSDLSNLEITLPSSEDEQRRIGSLVTNLDHLITFHQRKLDILKQYKTGVETQLFSEISTTKKIKDIIEILPKTNHPAGVGQSKGVYRFYTNNSTEQLYFDTFDYDAEAIISNTGGNANFEYCNDKFAASMHCMTFTSNINTKYLYYVLSYFVNRINFECFRGNGLKCLDKSWFANFDVPVPNVSEQNEITAILSEIDQLLYKEIHILNNLKLLKQGLLQQMFI